MSFCSLIKWLPRKFGWVYSRCSTFLLKTLTFSLVSKNTGLPTSLDVFLSLFLSLRVFSLCLDEVPPISNFVLSLNIYIYYSTWSTFICISFPAVRWSICCHVSFCLRVWLGCRRVSQNETHRQHNGSRTTAGIKMMTVWKTPKDLDLIFFS